jgi:hypothetical protein
MLAGYSKSILRKQLFSEGITTHFHKLSPVPTATLTPTFKIVLNSEQRMVSIDDVGVAGDCKCLMIKTQRHLKGFLKRFMNDISHFEYSPYKGINFQKLARKGIN